MEKQGNKESEGNVIDQADSKVEILPGAHGLIDMKDECRQANDRKMNDERRPTALLEKYKDPYAKPHQTDDPQENNSRRPAWDLVNML